MIRILTAAAVLGIVLAGPAHATIDLDDVFRMLEAGVSEQVIIKIVDADEARFVISSEDLINLSQAGASEWLLGELVARKVDSPDVIEIEKTYRVIEEPYSGYASFGIGWAYDPFDYYFATWPYYYAWYNPWPYYSNWWYYGGMCHYDWCYSSCYRADYYDQCWGTRTVWNRGYANDGSHVPTYRSGKTARSGQVYSRTDGYAASASGKTPRTGQVNTRTSRSQAASASGKIPRTGQVHTRTDRTQAAGASGKTTRTWTRDGSGSKTRSTVAPTRGGTQRSDSRSAAWGRPTRSKQAASAQSGRGTQVRSSYSQSGGSPSRGSAPARMSAPSRSWSAPARSSAPARMGSSAPARGGGGPRR